MNDAANTVPDFIPIKSLSVQAFSIPADFPESDGTIEWNSTTIVIVHMEAGNKKGIGYTYAQAATAYFIQTFLKEIVIGKNALDVESLYIQLFQAIRNQGNCGIAMLAVSAIDTALWDLKAKILELPLCNLLGKAKNEMLVYGSGGFTSYTEKQLQQQLSKWVDEGISYVKMKIGREPEKDEQRVTIARKAIGGNTNLFVDANGAYTIKQSLQKAMAFAQQNVTWFEEPVSSDDLEGLNFIRKNAASKMNIAAGEYGFNLSYFRAMLQANAVDILQADATRCGGITGFLKAGHLCEAFQIPFSSHCAPSLHLHAAIAQNNFFIAEYFHDHVRIEQLLFDGFCEPQHGKIKPDKTRYGIGIELKEIDAQPFKIF